MKRNSAVVEQGKDKDRGVVVVGRSTEHLNMSVVVVGRSAEHVNM